MNISKIAQKSGLPAKTIRYYEEIGLISPDRLQNGYRDYSENDGRKLQFLRRALSLGFSIEDCRVLLSLYEDKERESSEVKRVALAHLQTIEKKLAELENMHKTLTHLIDACNGDKRPDCPILDDLSGMFEHKGKFKQ